MRILSQRKELHESLGGESGHTQSEKLGLDVSNSELLGFGLLLVEVLLWKRDSREEKTEYLLSTKQNRHYLVLRKARGRA